MITKLLNFYNIQKYVDIFPKQIIDVLGGDKNEIKAASLSKLDEKITKKECVCLLIPQLNLKDSVIDSYTDETVFNTILKYKKIIETNSHSFEPIKYNFKLDESKSNILLLYSLLPEYLKHLLPFDYCVLTAFKLLKYPKNVITHIFNCKCEKIELDQNLENYIKCLKIDVIKSKTFESCDFRFVHIISALKTKYDFSFSKCIIGNYLWIISEEYDGFPILTSSLLFQEMWKTDKKVFKIDEIPSNLKEFKYFRKFLLTLDELKIISEKMGINNNEIDRNTVTSYSLKKMRIEKFQFTSDAIECVLRLNSFFRNYPLLENGQTILEFEEGELSFEDTNYTFDEILSFFKNNKKFTLTKKSGIEADLPRYCVNSLKNICIKNNKIVLLNLINEIEKNRIILNIPEKDILFSLLDLSFFMRGRGVVENFYPLKTSECTFEDLETHEKLLNEVMSGLNDCVYNLDLPLLLYDKKTEIFTPVSNNEQGLTIGERLRIVRERESVYSCVRISSNFILSSVYYYLKINGNSLDFDINKMDFIS